MLAKIAKIITKCTILITAKLLQTTSPVTVSIVNCLLQYVELVQTLMVPGTYSSSTINLPQY